MYDISCHIFRLNTLKGTAIIVTVVILDFSTLSGTNLQILTPKRYDEHPRHFSLSRKTCQGKIARVNGAL